MSQQSGRSKSNASDSAIVRRNGQPKALVSDWASTVSQQQFDGREPKISEKTPEQRVLLVRVCHGHELTVYAGRVETEYYYDNFDAYNTDSSSSPLASGTATPVSDNSERQLVVPQRKFKTVTYAFDETVISPQPLYGKRQPDIRRGSTRRKAPSNTTYQEEEGYASDDERPEPQRIKVKVHVLLFDVTI